MDPGRRGAGIGRRLVQAAEELVVEARGTEVAISVIMGCDDSFAPKIELTLGTDLQFQDRAGGRVGAPQIPTLVRMHPCRFARQCLQVAPVAGGDDPVGGCQGEPELIVRWFEVAGPTTIEPGA